MINTSRHDRVFSSEMFGDRSVSIVGCGAAGSRIGVDVGGLGVRVIGLYDGDVIEPHNVPNQAFVPSQVGQEKVRALADRMEEKGGIRPTAHPGFITGPTELGQVVFLAVDKMSVRRQIFEQCLHLSGTTEVVIEARMGVHELRVYTFDPSVPEEVAQWKTTLYDDELAEISPCGTSDSVGATAAILAGMAVWQLIRWFNQGNGAGEYFNEIVLDLSNMCVVRNRWR